MSQKANKAQSKQKAVEAVEKPIAPKATNGEAVRSIEAIMAEIDKAMKAGDIEKCQALFIEKAKAEKAKLKADADYRKANEAKFIEAKQTLSGYITEAIELALSEFAKANGDVNSYIGDKLTAIRITLAGATDKAGVVQQNTSTALQTASSKKASSGTRIGNFHAGERGNLLNSGMSEAQIVAKFGNDDEKASYESWKGTAFRNQRYSLAKRLLKANGLI